MQNVMENAKIQGIRQNLRPSWIRDFGLALVMANYLPLRSSYSPLQIGM